MGGIVIALARRPAARAFLAGAALLAASFSGGARGQAEEAPTAATRASGRGGPDAALPRPLDTVTTARVRRIFDAQRRGDLPSALRDSEQLDTLSPLGRALLGHILSDRYLGRFYQASPAELSGWLIAYADQPDAPAVHALLLRRLPRGVAAPPPPAVPTWEIPRPAHTPAPAPDPAVSLGAARVAALEHAVRERSEGGKTETALRLIARARGLSAGDGARLRAVVAQSLFAGNDDDAAFELARSAFRDSGGEAASPAYIAGLAAWRSGRSDEARVLFEAAAIAPDASAALHAAGSFWTARTLLRADDLGNARFWLLRAAEEANTFYGQLAAGILAAPRGKSAPPTRYREVLGIADLEAIAATPEGLAAFALLQVGEPARAEAELRRVAVRLHGNAAMIRAIRLVAKWAGLRSLRADLLRAAAGSAVGIPDLEPLAGFRVDPALIYGLIRTESNFDQNAVSAVGARGLMQLMPVTARALAGDASLDAESLDDPARNLELGQRYVLYLAHNVNVSEDLIRLLASYNAGPAKCGAWKIRDDGDPLLFIEAIPREQTRIFVQRVLAFTWLYAARLDLPAPSLAQLAGGEFPRLSQSPAAAPALVTRRAQLH
ncbi:MAG: lytic transglycosylase domain-containing protein [Alphaproteobacteria bacterium]|nr:lytic transglycosylase domain-containing protein [Alphaproteobacteria bacterium]